MMFRKSRNSKLCSLSVAFVVWLFSSTLWAQDITSNLVAYYTFDEGTGTTVGDSSGNGNNGTFSGSPTWIGSSQIDGGLDFEASDGADSISVGSFDVSGTELTLSAWIKPETDGYDQRIITKSTSSSVSTQYWQLNNELGSTEFRLKAGGTTDRLIVSTSLAAGTWYHLAGTYDGTTMRLYIDGVEVGNLVHSVGGALSTSASVPVVIGDSPSGSRAYDGEMDDVRVYQRALTATDITTLYAYSDAAASNDKTVLLVTAGSPLTSEESTRQSQFESWGYTVNTIEDSDTEANFGTALAAADVVYVPQSVDGSSLAYKLRTTSVGVVQEGVSAWGDEMGWTTSTGQNTNVCATMTVVDNTHAITQHFSSGTNTIFSSSTAAYGQQVVATVASGAQVLATNLCVNSGNANLLAMEIGSTLANTHDGNSTARGRRVHLPFGGAYTFSWSNVSADGLTMVQKALEWAASDSLVAHWKFDETSGTTAADATGNGHDGTLVNGPDWSTDAIHGGSLRFNSSGSTDRVDAGVFNITREITLATWVYVETRSNDSRLIIKANGNTAATQEWGISVDENGALQVRIGTTGGFDWRTTANDAVSVGRWHHVAGTYDGTTMRAYVDGELIDSWTHNYGGDLDVQATRTVSLGDSPTGSRPLYGKLDDARVYDRVLSDAEILELYGLVGHWKLDETSGTTAVDSSGQGIDLTAVNSPTLGEPGVRSYSARFDTTDEYRSPSAAYDDITSAVSIACWFRLDTAVVDLTGNALPVTCSDTGDNEGFRLLIGSASDILRMYIFDGTDSTNANHFIDGVGAGEWHHVAGVYDGSEIRLYFDGELVDTQPHTTGIASNDGYLQIGKNFPGTVDDVVVYNRAMTLEEIAEHYGLIAHWKLDEASGTTAADSSLAGNDATLTGSQGWTTGFDGGGHDFDGSGGDNYLSAPTSDSLEDVVLGSYTTMAFFRAESATGQQAILTKDDGDFGLDYASTGMFRVDHTLSDDTVVALTSSNSYPIGTFVHVAQVVDMDAGTLTLYINGVADGSTSFTPGMAGKVLSRSWRIGARHPTGLQADGVVDDVRIYNRALSAEEMEQFATYGLIAHWTFDEGTGTTIADASGSGNAVSFAAGTPTWTTGIRDGAIEFDGSADVDTDTNFSPPATGTIALWWYANATPTSTERVLGSGDSWELRYTSSERLSFDFGSGIVYYGSETYPPAKWYHLVFMYNSDDDTYSLYVNGQLTTSGSRTITAPSGGILSFGSRTGYSPSFNGRLDDVRVYNYELSTAEVTELFGLIGHWTFDEGSGTMIADSSLYANDAYFNAGTPTWTTGVMGGALEFDGSSDAVTGTEFDPPEEGCVALWIRCDAAPASRQRPFGLSNTFETYQDADGILHFDLNWSGAPDTLHPTEAFQFRSRWRHVLVNFRSSDDAYEVYLDGQLDVSGIYPSDLTKQAANFLTFGGRTGSTQYFTGALDDVRIYNRWLAPSEVADVYGLIARWNFEESSGTVASDSSGKDNHATFVSGPTLAASGAYSPNTGFGVELDGTSEYVDAGASLLNNLESFTLMGWIHPDSTTPDKSFFGQNDLVEVGIDYNSNQIDLWTANGGSISGTVPLSIGKWNHVTAVGDGTGLKLYLNGTEVATGGSATASYGSNSYDFRIGEGVLDATGDYFDGSFDDVRIYGRAATADEIFNTYRGGRPAGVRIIRWVETR